MHPDWFSQTRQKDCNFSNGEVSHHEIFDSCIIQYFTYLFHNTVMNIQVKSSY